MGVEIVQLALISRLPSHHHRITRADSHSTESPFALHREGFSTSSTQRKAKAHLLFPGGPTDEEPLRHAETVYF
jgi:hypothetical protein